MRHKRVFDGAARIVWIVFDGDYFSTCRLNRAAHARNELKAGAFARQKSDPREKAAAPSPSDCFALPTTTPRAPTQCERLLACLSAVTAAQVTNTKPTTSK